MSEEERYRAETEREKVRYEAHAKEEVALQNTYKVIAVSVAFAFIAIVAAIAHNNELNQEKYVEIVKNAPADVLQDFVVMEEGI